MTYILDWSNPSKGAITLPDTTVDTTSTSLTLYGLDAPNYGEGQQENFIRMLENFASDTPPPRPTSGQTWWDTTMNKLKAYDGTKWELASGGVTNSTTAPTTPLEGTLWYDLTNHKLMLWNGFQWMQVYPSLAAGNVVKVANVDEYNANVTKLNQIIGSPTGTTYAAAYGYGQYLVSTESISSLTNQKCIDLEAMVGRISTHLGMSTTSMGDSGYIYENGNAISKGIMSLVSEYNAMQSNVDNMLVGTNRFNATGLQALTPTAGSAVRSTAWNGTLTQEIVVSFDNANLLLGYFNAGGKVDFTAGLTGGSTSRDTVVQTFLSSLGTISFSAGGTTNGTIAGIMGMYGVSTTYANVFTTTSGASSYTIAARFETSNTVLRFRITIANTTATSPTVGGTLTSGITLKKAADANLTSPTVKHPMVASTTLSTTSNLVSVAITPQPSTSYRDGAGNIILTMTAAAVNGQSPYSYTWSNVPAGMTITGGSGGPGPLNSNPTIELTGILVASQTLSGEIKCAVTDGVGNVASATMLATMTNQLDTPHIVTSLLPGTPLSCSIAGGVCTVTSRNVLTVYYDAPYTSLDVSNVFLSPTLMPAGVEGTAFALTQGWVGSANGHQYYFDVTTNGPVGIYEATVIFTVAVTNSAGDNYTQTRNLVCRQTHI